MVLLSIIGLVRTILIVIGIYFLFKILSRFLFPILLKKMVERAAANMAKHQNFQTESKRKQGEINVDYVPKKDRRNRDDDGEYVDYVEIK
jgi:hypothetical protein